MRIIKKYKNRRLYDTELKKSITLEDLKSYLVDDIEFKVIDNASGEDITLIILSQVAGRSASDFKNSGIKVLNAIIKKGGIGGMDILKKLTLASIGAINLTREKIEEIFDEMVKRGEMTSDEKSDAIKSFVEKSTDGAEKMKEKMEDFAGRFAEKFSSMFNDRFGDLSEKIEELSKKIAELEKKVG